MKRFAYYIICCSLVALFSCTHDDIDEVLTPVGDSKITIQSTLDEMAITRAAEGEVDDTNPERTITHIDVFAIDENGNIDYYERNTTGNNNGAAVDGTGRLTLRVSRRAKDANDNYIFEQGANYKFILVANAVAEDDDMAELATLSDLERLVQDDSFETSFADGDNTSDGTSGGTNDDTNNDATEGETGNTSSGATDGTPTMSRQTLLHLSGTKLGENPDKETPQTFLMDAVATDKDGNKEWLVNPASGTVPTLNLSADFKRAASKIIVNIEQGADVEFRTLLDNESAQYDFYKLPASTFVLPNDSKLVNIQLINTAPMQQNTETFIWAHTDASNDTPRADNNIQIIGYAYSHSWSDVDLTNETSLILNIPMMWNKDNNKETGYEGGIDEEGNAIPNVEGNGKEEKAPKSWYKVPLSQGKKFERNRCYIVNIEINAVGASTRSTAIELRDIEYVTLDWVDVGINVGDSSDNPEYLTLNTDLVEIYNANFDNTSLKFSSSSAITSVTLKDVYSQNADGTFTAATDSYYAYYINKFGVKTNLSKAICETISATAEENVLNGGISILSPIVPETEAEVEKQILEQLGPAPTAPTLTEPTYDGTIPTAPDVVNEPTEPNPDDYVKNSTTSNGTERTIEDVEESHQVQERTVTKTSYGYTTNADGSISFYTYTETATQTRSREWVNYIIWEGWGNWSNWSPNTNSLEWGNRSSATADTTTQTSWNNAITEYNNQVAAYEKYVDDLAQYEADMAELNNKPEYQQYLADKAAYDAALADYNARLADYNERADAIRAAAGGEETHYNTIRYLEFEVKNAEGLTATFRVMQYPVVYITNIEGYFSYRSDFFAKDGTVVHYQNRKDPYLTQAYWASYTIQRQNGDTWTNVSTGYDSVYGDQLKDTRYADGYQLSRTGNGANNYVYTYEYTENGISYRKQYSGLSEVYDSDVRSGAAYGQNQDSPGRSNLVYYRINSNYNGWFTGTSKNPGNHRMYHVRITATSSQYAVGRPRLVDENGNYTNDAENGQTADDANNAILVSPSFMLASQLGVTSSTALSSTNGSVTVSDSQYQRAVEQCKNYVETTYDDANGNGIWDSGETVHHYNDWRLPTAAEIAIIAKLQNGSVAVDEVLAGKYYFCASPTRYADGKSSGTDGGFIRCIRDAY